MLLQDIVQILNNRLESLKAKKNIDVVSGELEKVYKLDLEISETTSTFNQLKTLVV
jgi:hypothetical protein